MGTGEAGIDANPVGKAAVAADAGERGLCALFLHAAQAPFAVPAAVALPADAYPLPRLQALHAAAELGHGADHFMPWNKRELADAPLVVDQAHIAVADAAV